MKCFVFAGTSLDGFLVRRHGEYDFPPEGGGAPHGYEEFITSVDVIGRHTFDQVSMFDPGPYPDKHVIVLGSQSSRPRPCASSA